MTQLEIEAFLTILRIGSISSASNALFVSQPALSRRINALESELGYPLFSRGKGIRSIELTEEGEMFAPIAKKYDALWREAKTIRAGKDPLIKIAAVGSVSSYMLPEVFTGFMEKFPECSLQFNNYHSLEAYDHVTRGESDLAFITDDMFSREVYTVPFFREKMVLAVSKGTKYNDCNSPRGLDGADEIRLPWNPEYDLWHDYWFAPSRHPRVELDQMSLLEYFMQKENVWAILPSHVARQISRIPGVQVRDIEEGPPEGYVIYYLTKNQALSPWVENFMSLFKDALGKYKDITLL